MADALRAGHRGGYAAVGMPVEGTILTVGRAAAEAAEAVRERPGGPRPRRVRPAAAAAREALARTPDQLRCCATPASSTPAAAASSVILDAAETVLTGRRPAPVTAPPAHTGSRSRRPGAGRRPRRRRAGVRGDVPARRRRRAIPGLKRALGGARRLAGRGRRRRALERPRPRRRRRRRDRGRDRRRAARTGSGSPTSPSRSPRPRATAAPAGDRPRRSSRSRRVRAWRSCSRRPAPPSCVGGPGNRPSTGQLLEAIRAYRRPGGHRAAQRRRLGAGRRGRGTDGRGRRRASGSR